MPVLVALAFLSVCLLPFVVSWIEATRAPQTQSGGTAEVSHDYLYQSKTLDSLEEVFAKANQVSGFKPVQKPLYLKVDLERIDDVNLARRSAFVSGKLTGVWGDQSLGRMSITPKQGYDALKSAPLDRDLLAQMFFPDLLEDGSLTYERILFKQTPLPGGKNVYISEYRFAGNLRFEPRLNNYPVDRQAMVLRLQHRILPAYMLRMQSLTPSMKKSSREAVVGNYRISDPYVLPPTVSAAYAPALEQLLQADFPNSTALQRSLARAERVTPMNPQEQFEFQGRPYGRLQSYFFAGSPSPVSVAAIRFDLSRRLASTWLRTVFPVSLSLLILVLSSYIPKAYITVNLGVAPSIFLALVFLQQSSNAQLPDMGHPILMDYYYLLSYVCTSLMFVEAIFAAFLDEKTPIAHAITTAARLATLATAVVGAPLIWTLGRLF